MKSWQKWSTVVAVVSGGALAGLSMMAQGPGGKGPGSGRKHQANEAGRLELLPASEPAPVGSVTTVVRLGERVSVRANGIPAHRVGRFPNRNNPHPIEEQKYHVKFPKPKLAELITPLHNREGEPFLRPKVFGMTLDGVLIEPGSAEFWNGDMRLGWNYDAIGGAINLGLDENRAHVQPGGVYHYHGIPYGLLKRLDYSRDKHSPMIGWAADGFPIYALTGYSDPNNPDSKVEELQSSFRLKKGSRPDPPAGPGGKYDGAFVQDFEYVRGLGDLDECNGRRGVTPEFPEGTYAYFLTKDWPVIPRAFRGTPIELNPMGAGGHPPHGSGGKKGPPPFGKKGHKGPPPRGR